MILFLLNFMEINTNSYKHMNKEQKPVFGAYLNLARNNMFTTLKHINSAVGATGGVDDNELQIYKMSVLTQVLTPEQEEQARRMFFLHFPFLKNLSSDEEDCTISFKKIREDMNSFVNVLSWWRDIYSHSNATERKSDKNDPNVAIKYANTRMYEHRVTQLLPIFVTVAARKIKERYSPKNDAQKGMLDEKSMEFITNGRYKPSRTPAGGRKMILNKRHFLYPVKEGDLLPNGNNHDRLSESGLIQLICLFLEKKYTMEFLSQIHFLDGFSETAESPKLPQRRLLLETMSELRVRLPESRLHSEHDETQVALDILGELKKCPSEVFELLSSEDKARFSIKSSTGEDVLLRRNSDRFVTLALSFLDTTNAFPNLRFQVNAGVFRYMFDVGKHCIDGKTRMRVLQKPLNGFGRIQEVEKKRCPENRTIWNDFKLLRFEDTPRNDESCLPYISDTYTRYLLDGDNIGVSLSGEYIPEIRLREDNSHYDVLCRKADCTISRFDLPALLFYHLLHQATQSPFKSAEDLISEKVKSYRQLFSDIEEGKITPFIGPEAESNLSKIMEERYGIGTKDIPEKLMDFLLGKADEGKKRFKKFKEGVISKMMTETQHRLDIIIEQKKIVMADHNPKVRSDNKPGKKGFVQIKPGSLASFLAEDIVLMQSGDSKLTGLNYSVMQGSMATFSSHDQNGRANLIRLFKKAGLISDNDDKGSHPFLWSVMKDSKVTSTVELYIKYLEARGQYLSAPVPDDAPFLHAGKSRWAERNQEYYKELAKRYKEQPIALDGSVFEKPIRDILQCLGNKSLSKEIQDAINKTGRCNTAYMIQLYQSFILDDYPQSFYGLVEGDMQYFNNYRLFSVVQKYRKEAGLIREGLKKSSNYRRLLDEAIKWAESHPKERTSRLKSTMPKPSYEEIREKIRSAYNALSDNERLLRRLATQDILLFMAATTVLKKTLNLPDLDLKLSQIGDNDDCNLNRRLPKVVRNFTFYWKDTTDNNVQSKPKEVAVEIDDVCIKDYADILRIVYDRRVASLVHHLDINTISVENIKKELDTYDHRRVPVFKDIFEYENKVLGVLSEDQVPVSPDFEAVQKEDHINSPEDKFAASIIRNSFCHNQYPTKKAGSKKKNVYGVSIYEGDIPEVAESMAKKIAKFSKNTK